MIYHNPEIDKVVVHIGDGDICVDVLRVTNKEDNKLVAMGIKFDQMLTSHSIGEFVEGDEPDPDPNVMGIVITVSSLEALVVLEKALVKCREVLENEGRS